MADAAGDVVRWVETPREETATLLGTCRSCRGPVHVADAIQRRTIDGRRYVVRTVFLRCAKCLGHEAKILKHLKVVLASTVAATGDRSGEVVRLMREALVLNGGQLSEVLGVHRSVISRWEHDAVRIPRAWFMVMAAMVRDAEAGRRTTRELLAAVAKAAEPRKITA